MNTCITCKGPLKPLFTSMFCPRRCDRGARSQDVHGGVEFELSGFRYRAQIIAAGATFPLDAHFAWGLCRDEVWANPDLSLEEIIRLLKLSSRLRPGWRVVTSERGLRSVTIPTLICTQID